MSTFTLFCHGTNEHRSRNKEDELIHALSAHAAGEEYRDYLVLDGPGAAGADASNPMAGSFDPFDRSKGGKTTAYSRTTTAIMDVTSWEGGQAATYTRPNSIKMYFQNAAAGAWSTGTIKGRAAAAGAVLLSPLALPIAALGVNASSKAQGLLVGNGMDDNIRHAVAAMANLWPDFHGHVINMVGWSRGAVSCIRAANWIQEFFGPGCEVNIFAIDPVAGGDLGEQVKDTFTIPRVVKKLVAVLAIDERRGGFKPQDVKRLKIQDRTATQVALLPFPGSHDTALKLGKNDALHECAEVTRYLAFKFLMASGTRFEAPEPGYTAVELAERYAEMMLKRDGYQKLAKTGLGKAVQGGIVERNIARQINLYVSHSPRFFLNEHHVECFKSAFPRIYQFFFTASSGLTAPKAGARSVTVASGSEWGREFENLLSRSRASYALLESLGILVLRAGSVWTAKPSGLYQGDNGAMSSGRAMLRHMMEAEPAPVMTMGRARR